MFPGSTVYYVGQLSTKVPTGQVTSAPIERTMVRSGTLGALDQRELPLGEYDYPVHLVDCRSYRGFSGSPCFVELTFAYLTQLDAPPPSAPKALGPYGDVGHLTLLCGMFTNHLEAEAEGGEVSRPGVGFMLRSEEIREALMTDEIRSERARADDAVAARADERIDPA